jgi:hypothetical protein
LERADWIMSYMIRIEAALEATSNPTRGAPQSLKELFGAVTDKQSNKHLRASAPSCSFSSVLATQQGKLVASGAPLSQIAALQ